MSFTAEQRPALASLATGRNGTTRPLLTVRGIAVAMIAGPL